MANNGRQLKKKKSFTVEGASNLMQLLLAFTISVKK